MYTSSHTLIVRSLLPWIHKCLQNTDVFCTQDSYRLHVFKQKIIGRIELFPLYQLTSCVEAKALDEVAKDAAIYSQWLPTHIIQKLFVVNSSLLTGSLTLQDQADRVCGLGWQRRRGTNASHLAYLPLLATGKR